MSTMNIFDLTDTWNAAGTTFSAIKMNATDTASAAGSALLDLQVGGVSQFKVSKAGAVTAVGVAIPTISSSDTLSNKTLSSPTISGTVTGAASWNNTQTFSTSTTGHAASFYANYQSDTGLNAFGIVLGGNKSGGSAEVNLIYGSSGAGLWFGSWDGATYTVRAKFDGSGNFNLETGALSVAGVAVPTISSTDTLSNKTLTSPVFTNTTVAGLPAAATAGSGARAFVTDALGPTFGAVVVGGGAVKVPVFSTGAAWNVG